MAALERLEADAKLKRQNFGSQSYSPPKSSVPSASQVAAAHPQPAETSDATLKKGTTCAFPGLLHIKETGSDFVFADTDIMFTQVYNSKAACPVAAYQRYTVGILHSFQRCTPTALIRLTD